MRKKRTAFIAGFCFFLLAVSFWYLKKTTVYQAASLLSDTYKLEAKCASKEPLEFPIEPFDRAEADPDCVPNFIRYGETRGLDPKKTSPEKYCRCLHLNLYKVIEKYNEADDQCLMIQARNFVEARCRELATQ